MVDADLGKLSVSGSVSYNLIAGLPAEEQQAGMKSLISAPTF